MSPLQFALAEIRDEIPEEVLELAFIPKTKYKLSRQKFLTTSIEQQIMDKVINGRVRRHVDAQGAQEITIDLNGLKREKVGPQAWIMHIPKTLTRGRSITHVLGIHIGVWSNSSMDGATPHFGFGVSGTYLTSGGISSNSCNSNAQITAVNDLLQTFAPTELNYTANVYLIDENTIYCEDNMSVMNLVLRCKVSADSEFSFIQGAYVRHFAKLCILATKAWIYKNINVRLDKAYIEGGVEVSKIREIVDDYRDASEQFNDFIQEKWRKIQRMTDKPRRMNYINGLITKGF
jgi:hypothetical protein